MIKIRRNYPFIYIKGRKLNICLTLAIVSNKGDKDVLYVNPDYITSINRKERYLKKGLTLKEVFWAYCSSFQAWAENDYDTSLLHFQTSFPILKKLAEAGDLKAKDILNQEIIKRLKSGDDSVAKFLITEDYLSYLEEEKKKIIVLELIESYLKIINSTKEDKSIKSSIKGRYLELVAKLYLTLEDYSNVARYYLEAINAYKATSDGRSEYHLMESVRLYQALSLIPQSEVKFLRKAEKILQTKLGYIRVEDDEYFYDLSFKVREGHVNELYVKPHIYDESNHFLICPWRANGDLALKNINHLTHLRKLNITQCDLTEFPKEILNIPSLVYLEMNGDEISEIPDEISQLDNLEELYLSLNLTTLPKSFMHLNKLKKLTLSGNQFKIIPDVITKIDSLETLTKIGYHSEKLPKDLGRLKNLKVLDLYWNKFEAIPDSIGNLESLKILKIGRNKLKILPENMKRLKNLEYLDLSENNLEKVPSWIDHLTSLKTLILNNNQIDTIPDTLGNLKHLKYLYLSNNNISHLPSTLSSLVSIKTLSVGQNPLTEKADKITKKVLKVLKEKVISSRYGL